MRRSGILVFASLALAGCGRATPAPECATDADCDDGLYCTGVETCDRDRQCQSSGSPCAAGGRCDPTTSSCYTPIDDWTTVSAGTNHTCAIDSIGRALCWGRNQAGQLGDGNYTWPATSPILVDDTELPDGDVFVDIAAGSRHTCAVTSSGALFCWGQGAAVGVGDAQATAARPAAVDVDPALAFRSVVAGAYHSCALTDAGQVYCWGDGFAGRIGHGTTEDALAPVPIDSTALPVGTAFDLIAAGCWHTCGATAGGALYCWGVMAADSLGFKSMHTSPYQIERTNGWRGLSSGCNHACALDDGGVAWCWGRDDRGQLGMDDQPSDDWAVWPVDRSGLAANEVVTAVAAGWDHSCSITSAGRTFCWGSSYHGELGLPPSLPSDKPLPVLVEAFPKSIDLIDAGANHTCAIAGQQLSCWGGDAFDVLGDGGDSYVVPAPASPVAATSIAGVSAAPWHTCALGHDNHVYCWGWNGYGELGAGEPPVASSVPLRVDTRQMSDQSGFASVATASSVSCAVTHAGGAFCWGSILETLHPQGVVTPTPVDSSALSAEPLYREVVTTYSHGCALAADGHVYCWELDDMLAAEVDQTSLPATEHTAGLSASSSAGVFALTEAGDPYRVNAWTRELLPFQPGGVLDGTPLRQVVGLRWGHCALTLMGEAYCWGDNYYGLLGVNAELGAHIPEPTPVDVSTMDGATTFRQLCQADMVHVCGIATDNAVYCWGNDEYETLGEGIGGDYATIPVAVDLNRVEGTPVFVDISCGGVHSCVTTDAGEVYCWGTGSSGRLGLGKPLAEKHVPVVVEGREAPQG